MYKIVLVRHGESTWNAENRFTGWTDVDLTKKGIAESHAAAKSLKEAGYTFDIAYTSTLKRAIRTLWIILDDLDLMWIPIVNAWQLNERHYGELQGLNKSETAAKYGEEQVHIWRRSFATRPPTLTVDDSRYPAKDPRYMSLSKKELPIGESLKDVIARVLPYWKKVIVPDIKKGKRIIISASGNSQRAMMMYLDNIPEAEIVELNIPTGIPLVYELDGSLKPIRHYYLADEETVKKAIQTVKDQGKAKK